MEEKRISNEDVAAYIRELNIESDRPVEKVLIRVVNPELYACQVWYSGEREPESFFLHIDEDY